MSSSARGLSELYFKCQNNQLIGEYARWLPIWQIEMLLMMMIQTDFVVAVNCLKEISSWFCVTYVIRTVFVGTMVPVWACPPLREDGWNIRVSHLCAWFVLAYLHFPFLLWWNIMTLPGASVSGDIFIEWPMLLLSTGDRSSFWWICIWIFKTVQPLCLCLCVGIYCPVDCYVMPALLLQRSSWKSKPHDHIACLEQCLPLWLDGDVDALLAESFAIQQWLRHSRSSSCCYDVQVFTRLMF